MTVSKNAIEFAQRANELYRFASEIGLEIDVLGHATSDWSPSDLRFAVTHENDEAFLDYEGLVHEYVR